MSPANHSADTQPSISDGIQHVSSGSRGRVSTILIENLHCSSCVRTIEETLSTLSPAPTNVHVSIVAQTVSFRHSPELNMSVVNRALEEAGFDLVNDHPLADSSTSTPKRMALTKSVSLLSTWSLGRKKEKHAEHCMMCRTGSYGHIHDEKHDPTATLTEQSIVAPGKTALLLSPTTSHASAPTVRNDQSDEQFRATMSIGGMTCSACVNTLMDVVTPMPGVSDVHINLLDHSGTFVITSQATVNKIVEAIEDCGYEAEIANIWPVQTTSTPRVTPASREEADGPQHIVLSIGGMTCASCSNAIVEVLSQLCGVSDVVVNLLGNSATMTIERKEIIYSVLAAIEDLGYEGELVANEPIQREHNQLDDTRARTVTLLVEGMFCERCPLKITDALRDRLESYQVNIIKAPTINVPVMQIQYTPMAPSFTLRTIMRVIAAAKSSDSTFTVSVYKPPTLEERTRRMHIREQRALLLRLLFSVVAAVPTFVIGIVYMSLMPEHDATRMWFMAPLWAGNVSRMEWALFIIATPVMFYSAGLFHSRSIKEIRALWRPRNPTPTWKRFVRFGSMNLLVSAGVSVAYYASIALLGLAASEEPAMMGDTTTYFDSVVFLTMFLLIGRYMEAYSKTRTADAITALGNLRPSSALVLTPSNDVFSPLSSEKEARERDVERDSSESISAKPGFRFEKVAAELLEVGDIVRVLHGSTPPADGTIISRQGALAAEDVLGTFDESSLTGESKPVKKQAGDKVFLGTINKGGVVDVRVDATGGESMLDHVVSIVREGQTKRAPIERVADMVTAYFVPIITLFAILTWVIWLSLGLSGALPESYLDVDVGGWPVWSLEFAIAVFVVACPCGIGLAAPTALLVGSGLAAKFGILARGGGEAFQEAAQLDLVVFDKTGTLTEGGEPKVTDIHFIDTSLPEAVVLGVALELEGASGHPLATAIRQYCETSSASPQQGSTLTETPGRGLRGIFEALNKIAVIGNEAWMDAHSIVIDGKTAEQLDKWKSEGKSVVLLALGDASSESPSFNLAASFAVADRVRPEAKAVLSKLQEQGIATWMVSGDNVTTAKAVAHMVGIPETNVIAGVLPHEKADKIKWLQQVGQKRPPSRLRQLLGKHDPHERCIVAMVGDGINDAPALTAADVGIAIGSGSDVAISSAAFILLTSNLRSLLVLCDLSRTVFRRVKLNFIWASVYNLIALPIAAGVIYPAGNARLDPVWASLAMALSSVSVVCSSLLLKLYREPKLKL